jgi:hypothetical protein
MIGEGRTHIVVLYLQHGGTSSLSTQEPPKKDRTVNSYIFCGE